MAALDIRNLHVSYGQRAVLRGVGLSAAAGEVVGLVGPNGCGKTTLLKAITHVVPWRSGEVRLLGEPASKLPPRELSRRVAVVPQNPILPVGYTTLEVVLMGRTPHLSFLEQEGAEDYRQARQALQTLGVLDLADRRVDELSGGERQNVVLARALAQEAPILLLDEPTANLDIGHQIAVARLVRELAHRSQLAVLAAIHDLTLASLYCDRVVLMAGGIIIATGTPAEVLTAANIAQAYDTGVVILKEPSLPAPAIIPYLDGAAKAQAGQAESGHEATSPR
ncbi:MAG: ABC transporter ATP-binding protein [Dehalococcoidia bacterium]